MHFALMRRQRAGELKKKGKKKETKTKKQKQKN